MIGIVLVSHAGIADELLHAAELILGPVRSIAAVSISRDMSIDVAKEKLQQALKAVNNNQDGVIILTDLFGGTPTNLSAEFLQDGDIEILTGVNLPMLLKGISSREDHDLNGLATLLKDYAQNAIMRPSELLRSVR
ncbi:PTS system, mannose-specific IIA component [Desulfuromusa kysingii]|uniref:PTS system, mannose-specific IIA component n=1 Tax=Desulfuromusa kysingii TaxID=37625 RepID=A0A1H3ZMZ1_9BACT|nr:PTS system fructose subfamily IIA component [Desulfuromusa kysingii]SEA25159.1 PTS system, mannose-specific IIA component [Desulfuromusa kysingii]